LSARRVRHQVDVATGGKIPSDAPLNFLRFTAICEAVLATDLCTAFNQYFELVHADSDQLREEVFRLRYQVYIVETGFERCEDHPDGIERDAFDERSDHYLLRHRASGFYAATARMILPDLSAPLAPFPIERHCPFYDGLAIRDPEARRRLGELSRFAVSKAFKKRIGEAGSLIGVAGNVDMYFEPDERRVLPHLSLGLFAAELRMMHEHGLTHGYAVMEPALYRLLGRFGATFDQIGPAVDYHGERIPCLGAVNELLPNIKRVARSVWELMTDTGRYTCGTE
jgi:N-acyl amino acid synthase of PEP-CTERM/exosortase system